LYFSNRKVGAIKINGKILAVLIRHKDSNKPWKMNMKQLNLCLVFYKRYFEGICMKLTQWAMFMMLLSFYNAFGGDSKPGDSTEMSPMQKAITQGDAVMVRALLNDRTLRSASEQEMSLAYELLKKANGKGDVSSRNEVAWRLAFCTHKAMGWNEGRFAVGVAVNSPLYWYVKAVCEKAEKPFMLCRIFNENPGILQPIDPIAIKDSPYSS
jgi:hypothetical protein